MIPGMYEPADALVSPRFTGPRTFARLPYTDALEGVDCALHGIPWDGGTSFRSGARFGPEGIRSASALLRPYNPAQGVAVFGALSCVDRGDAPTVPGYIGETLDRIADWVEPIARAGVIPLGMGGDHSVTLGELRGLARVHGPLGLVHLDAHGDLWDRYFGLPLNHGTVFRRALDEGLIDPARTLQAGHARPALRPRGRGAAGDARHRVHPGPGPARAERGRVRRPRRARESATGPTFFTFDVDFLDPAVCPATGTPEPGGPSAERALDLVRALQGIDFRGFDVVEVAPQYDGPGQITSLLAANVLYEMLTLVAIAKGLRATAARCLDQHQPTRGRSHRPVGSGTRSTIWAVAEYQITYWRELPSMVVAREGDDQVKVPLHERFQEAIDEAAMRLGDVGSDAYLAGWERSAWTAGEGSPADLAAAVAARLEEEWSPEAVTTFLDTLGAPAEEQP